MVCGSVDVLFLVYNGVVPLFIYQACVLSAVECLVYSTLKARYIFLLIIILLPFLSVTQVNVPGVSLLLYSGGLQLRYIKDWVRCHLV